MTFPEWTSDCGTVRLINADCLQVLPTLAAGSVDAVVTDPPYSSGGAFRGDRMSSTRNKYQSTHVKKAFAGFSGDNRDQRGFFAWVSLWMSELRIASSSGAMACLFTDWRQLPTTTDAMQAGGWVWRGIVPWDKVLARPQPGRFRAQAEFVVWGTNGPREHSTKGASYHDGCFRFSTPATVERVHSTQKPVELMEKIVAVADLGEQVIDPFMGSGTTGVACVNLGRKFIGIEIDPGYFEIAKKRIQAALAEKASQLIAS